MINCCVYGVPPAPVYKGARGGGGRPGRGVPRGGVLLPLGVGLLLFLVGVGEGKERERRRRKEGAGPLALNQFGLGLGGTPHTPLAALYFH